MVAARRRLCCVRRVLWLGLIVSLFCFAGEGAFAQEAPRPLRDVPLREIIDEQIAAGYQKHSLTPAEHSSDAEFLRRVSLDLTGAIPTVAAARAFIDDPAADKRERLVDALLASPEYARHMQHVFDVMLLERQYGNYVTDPEWREYLRASFAANKPWDQFVRELVGTDGVDPAVRPAIKFYTVRTIDSYRVLSPTAITRDIGRLLLGVNLQCAQCHDHPTIPGYKQADYHGLMAFVNRAHFVSTKQGDKDTMMIAEKADGAVKFVSVFDAEKKEPTAVPRLPGGPEFVEPKLNPGEEYKVKPADGVVPVPVFSPRSHLMNALTAADNGAFRRNIANRLWQLMFGRGLVHPPDLHHDENAASHPELLAVLADRFAADKFDIKKSLREMALSKTYQLASTLPTGGAPPPEAFAVSMPRPLRPEQFASAMLEASGVTEATRVGLGAQSNEAAIYEKLIAPNLKPFIDLYARPPGQAENRYDPSLFQALFLQNAGQTVSFLDAQPGKLIDRLMKITEPAALAEELYLSIYTRRPDAEETAAVVAHLQGRDADRAAALQELAWAMLASAEFRFNH